MSATSLSPTASAGSSASTDDPPLTFGTPGVLLPPVPTAAAHPAGAGSGPLPAALHGADAYIAGPDSMQVVDTRTGKVLATVHPQGAVLGGGADPGPVSAPLVAAVGDSTLSLALVPFLVTAPAQGSTPTATAVELVAVDTSTWQTVWRAQIAGLPAWASDGSVASLSAGVVGVQGDTAVIGVSGAGMIGAAVGIDLMTHQVTWHKDGFEAEAVTGEAVVGRVAKNSSDPVGAESSVAALDPSSGDQLWKELDADSVTVSPAAPGKVVVNGVDHLGGADFSYLVDAGSGKRTALAMTAATVRTCTYDGAAVLVCADRNTAGDHLLGLDATSGAPLWTLPGPTPEQPLPTVTAAWHGGVYGTTAHGPVVLDARTGTVLAAAPGTAPALLDDSVGLSPQTALGAITAYRVVKRAAR